MSLSKTDVAKIRSIDPSVGIHTTGKMWVRALNELHIAGKQQELKQIYCIVAPHFLTDYWKMAEMHYPVLEVIAGKGRKGIELVRNRISTEDHFCHFILSLLQYDFTFDDEMITYLNHKLALFRPNPSAWIHQVTLPRGDVLGRVWMFIAKVWQQQTHGTLSGWRSALYLLDELHAKQRLSSEDYAILRSIAIDRAKAAATQEHIFHNP